ncbi:MAG: SMI1/KNR4 family protein [Firmicutes bacterium]|nr:SMI1/KNR4 family protein [Bacillota bacterium]
MINYKSAVSIMKANGELCDFVGSIDQSVINKAEKVLGVSFSKTYRAYLSEFGAGNFGSQEIYGIISENFIDSGVPDAIWLTLKERKENNLPEELVIIYFSGDEYYYCLDTSEFEGDECPIVAVHIGQLACEREKIYDSFSEFLLEIIDEELE